MVTVHRVTYTPISEIIYIIKTIEFCNIEGKNIFKKTCSIVILKTHLLLMTVSDPIITECLISVLCGDTEKTHF